MLEYIKSKLSPAAIFMGIKGTIIGTVKAIISGGPLVILGFLVSYFTSWWAIAVIAFFFTAFQKDLTPKAAFGICMAAGVVVWSAYATYLNAMNDGLIGTRIGSMLTGNQDKFNISATNLIQATGLMGGLLAAMGGMTGALARDFFYDTRLKFGWKW